VARSGWGVRKTLKPRDAPFRGSGRRQRLARELVRNRACLPLTRASGTAPQGMHALKCDGPFRGLDAAVLSGCRIGAGGSPASRRWRNLVGISAWSGVSTASSLCPASGAVRAASRCRASSCRRLLSPVLAPAQNHWLASGRQGNWIEHALSVIICQTPPRSRSCRSPRLPLARTRCGDDAPGV
jgi:hypothetical protein